MSKTLNAESIVPRPTAVNAAACSASSRILRSTVDSSPCDPPPYTVTVTRPSVACFHSSAICLRFLSQMDPSGTTVASLIGAWAVGKAVTDKNTATVTSKRRDRGGAALSGPPTGRRA